jgi:hypothetical protein
VRRLASPYFGTNVEMMDMHGLCLTGARRCINVKAALFWGAVSCHKAPPTVLSAANRPCQRGWTERLPCSYDGNWCSVATKSRDQPI